jgi:NodT family efflux transporter outer membrane factor (OMF) lipoprotein
MKRGTESLRSDKEKGRTGGRSRAFVVLLTFVVLLGACNVGPKYHTPSVQTPAGYKELAPANALPDASVFKVATPSDSTLRGKWWEVYNDPKLNELEDQVDASNQNIAAAVYNFSAARAIVREARAQYYPTLTTDPSITKTRTSANQVNANTGTGSSHTLAVYNFPFDATWEPDLWGRVSNTVREQAAAAQVSAADLENTRLTMHAELAVDYFQLHTEDALQSLLDSTVAAYQDSLNLTQALYETGIDSEESVSQARTQLQTTQAEATGVGIVRAQFEHAIAVLVGQPASTFSIAPENLQSPPPAIPVGIPSELLQRRPDIAAAERTMEESNAQIGIARAAYFPTLTLSGSGGFESDLFTEWISWPSRVWSVGTSMSETIFDAGLRRATVQQFRATYDASVANYRETVLAAFQQVEDNLAALRILKQQIHQQDDAVKSAEQTVALATDRYKTGLDPYLNVIVAQAAMLADRQTDVNLRMQQMTASVQLIEALGGGWNTSQLPSQGQVAKGPGDPPPAP